MSRQSRTFDYIAPFAPHESLPAATVLAGLGMLLIAASGLMLIGRRRIKPWLSRLTLVIMMTKPLILGLLTLVSPVTGGMPGSAGAWLVAEIVIDLGVAAVLLITPNDLLDDYRRLLLYAVPIWLVGWVGGVLDKLFWSLLNESAEVPPGSGSDSAADHHRLRDRDRVGDAERAGRRIYQPRVPGPPLNGPLTAEVIQPP